MRASGTSRRPARTRCAVARSASSGYGNIGSQLSVLAEALGMKVACYDTAEKLVLGNTRSCASLDELLAISDIVTLHVDGRPGNAGMFGAAQFAQMRKGAVFLNLSRGFVLDNPRSPTRCAADTSRGAAIDVFPIEPLHQGDAFESDLRGAAQRHPHPAHRWLDGGGPGGHRPVRRGKAARLRATRQHHAQHQPARDRAPPSARLAAARAPAQQHSWRAGHRQRPAGRPQGEHRGQVLATRDQHGYLLTDINRDLAPAVFDGLAAMPQTLRLRILR